MEYVEGYCETSAEIIQTTWCYMLRDSNIDTFIRIFNFVNI
jgi:hypothetical protein